MNRKWALTVRRAFPALLASLVLSLGMGAAGGFSQMEWRQANLSPEDRVIMWKIQEINYHQVDQSLEAREMVDFLATPALLVQEAVSDGVILTYPQE